MNREEKPESLSFFGKLIRCLIVSVVIGAIAAVATWYFASDIPDFASTQLEKGRTLLSSLATLPFEIPGEYQHPMLAGLITAVMTLLVFIASFAYNNPKTVATVLVLAAGAGAYFYWGIPDPTPDPVDPNVRTVAIKFNNKTDSAVSVWSNGKNYGELGRSGGSKSFDLPEFASVSFEANPALENGYTIPTVKLSNKAETFDVNGHRRWGDVPSRNRITNYRANKYSFDIRYVDPFSIDSKNVTYNSQNRKGGLRKQIFQDFNDLKDSTYHYHETDVSNYYIEQHFNARALNEGWIKATGTAYGTAKSLREGFNASVTANAEFGGAKGSRGASYEHMKESGQSSDSVYIMTRTEQKLYQVDIEKDQILLTKEFKDAVLALPDQFGQEYRQFIDQWGTHFAKSVAYGGIAVQVDKVERGAFQDLVSSGFSLSMAAEVPVKGGSVGGSAEAGYTRESEYSRYFENSTRITQWKGGAVSNATDIAAYSVSADNVQPISIDFRGTRLSTLLTSKMFKDGTTEQQLAAKRTALQRAEQEVAGSSDDPREHMMRVYHVHCNSMKRTPASGETDYNPYLNGTVDILITRKDGSKVPGKNKRLYSPADRTVEFPDNKKENFQKRAAGGKTQLVLTTKNPGDYKASLFVNLKFNHRSYSDGSIGPGGVTIGSLSSANADGVPLPLRPNATASEGWGTMHFDCEIIDVTHQWFNN